MLLSAADWSALAELQPLAARAAAEDPAALIRLRLSPQTISGFVRMPFEVIAGRTIRRNHSAQSAAAAGLTGDATAALGEAAVASTGDLTMSAVELCSTLTEQGAGTAFAPARKDAQWLAPLPPATGWQRLDLVPEHVVREIVRANQVMHQEGVAGSRSAQRTLLRATVITVDAGERAEQIPLRALTALTKLGFLPTGGAVAADQARGWLRLAAAYGSTFVPADTGQLNLLIG